MPLQGYYSGVLPPFVILPPTGPTGVLPAVSLADATAVIPPRGVSTTGVLPPPESLPDRGIAPLSRLAIPIRQRIQASVMPPVGPGEGYFTALGEKVSGMDVIRGMDRTLGKGLTIQVSRRRAQSMRLATQFTTPEALGTHTGQMARMFA